MAVLGLRFCARALSSCGKRGPLFIMVLWQAGATLHSLSCCGAQAPDAQAQQLWLTGPAAPRHVGSSQTRARTRVPCIGRQTPNHCATREAPGRRILNYCATGEALHYFIEKSFLSSLGCFGETLHGCRSGFGSISEIFILLH